MDTTESVARFNTARERRIHHLLRSETPIGSMSDLEDAERLLVDLMEARSITGARFRQTLAWMETKRQGLANLHAQRRRDGFGRFSKYLGADLSTT